MRKKAPSKQSVDLANELSGIIADNVLKSTIGFEDRIKNDKEKPFVLAFAMSIAVNVLFEGQIEEFIDLIRETQPLIEGAPSTQ